MSSFFSCFSCGERNSTIVHIFSSGNTSTHTRTTNQALITSIIKVKNNNNPEPLSYNNTKTTNQGQQPPSHSTQLTPLLPP